MNPSWLERLAKAIPLGVYRRLLRREAVGVFYHAVSDEPLRHIRLLYAYKTPAQFERDLAYLQAHYRLVSYAELEARREGMLRLPANAAFLSFDDGLRQCFDIVRPILLRESIPCIFFITTGLVDNRAMMYRHKAALCVEKMRAAGEDWRRDAARRLKEQETGAQAIGELGEGFEAWILGLNYLQREAIDAACEALEVDVQAYLREQRPYLCAAEIRTLAGEGFTIGGHSKDHPKLNLLGEDEVEAEVVDSVREVLALSGQKRAPFAFPFSGAGLKREFLAGMLRRRPEVGLLFEARGLRRVPGYALNRVMADAPLATEGSDLPLHLHRAYEEAFVARVKRG